jgi:olefin beta-lactone synthetase
VGGLEKDENIASHLVNASAVSPNQLAIVSAKEGLFKPRSFKELNLDVQNCAAYLRSKRISKGDHVLLAVKPGYQLILIAFSLFYLGAVPIIIDPGMGLKAFLKCIKNTKPSALIGISLIHIMSKFLPVHFRSVEKKVLIQSNRFLNEINKGERDTSPKHATTLPEDLAAIVFTSGSTGTPKGVSYTHQVFGAQINHLKNDFDIQRGEKDLATLPIFALFNPALGVTSVIPDMNPGKPSSADPQKLTQAIQEFEITTAFTSPIIGKKIAASCNSQKILLSHIKRFFLAGAPAHPSLVKDLARIIPNGKVLLPYGATEALPVSVADHIDVNNLAKDIALGNGSCLGRPLTGNLIRISPITFSPYESGINCPKELPQGEVGEICVSGSVVSQEYFRMPGATHDSKFYDGQFNFHRMGDLGYFDADGFLRFLGRKAERIITKDGPLETERCEPLINGMKEVSKSALIGIGRNSIKLPCIVVELFSHIKQKDFPTVKEKVLEILKIHLPAFSFKYVVFEKCLPVDSRHNVKIHRLFLSKKWTKLYLKNPSKYFTL